MYILNIIFCTFQSLLPNLNYVQLIMLIFLILTLLFYFLQYSFGRIFVRNIIIIILINFLIFYFTNYTFCKNEINESINNVVTPNIIKGALITGGVVVSAVVLASIFYNLPETLQHHYIIPLKIRTYKLEAEILYKRDPVMEVIMTNPSAIRQPKNAVHLEWLIFLKHKYLQYTILSADYKASPKDWIIIGEGIHQINTKYQELNNEVTTEIVPYMYNENFAFEIAKNLSNVDSNQIVYVPPFAKKLLLGLNNLNGRLDLLIKEYPVSVMSAAINEVELKKFSASYLLGLKYNSYKHLNIVNDYKKYTFDEFLMAYPVSQFFRTVGILSYPIFDIGCYLLGIPNPITKEMYFALINNSLNIYSSPYYSLGTIGINETDLFNKIDLTNLGEDTNELIRKSLEKRK